MERPECQGDEKRETDEQLLRRYFNAKSEVDRAQEAYKRMRPGPARTRRVQWTGCLRFTLLQIESELNERGIAH